MRTILRILPLVISFGALPLTAAEPDRPLPFDAANWKLSGDATIGTYLGRPALRMSRGGAEARNVAFRDGTLDFDLAIGTHRNFPIVELRKTGEGDYEEFYVRTHKSELPDAVQYVPAWQGVGGWQLYHGPGFTAKATFPRDRWFPVRIVLSGTKAAVFVGDVAEPQLVVSRLRREPLAGGLAFEALLPTGAAPEGYVATNISNVVLRPGFVPYDFSRVSDVEPSPPGVVAEWQLSAAFAPPAGPIREKTLAAASKAGVWKTVEAEPSGLVVFERWIERPDEKKVERPAALARIRIEADEATTKAFRFGWSDEVTVFLNGRPLFSSDATYSFDNPRRQGLIGLWQGTVYLPLQKGSNELVLAVADVFGGWGVMGQFENPTGITVRADGRLP
jgi:hypothetical protein